MISDRDPVAAAVQLYNSACTRSTRTRLTWFDSSVHLEYQGGDQCRVSLGVFIPHATEKIYECVYFNNIPDGIKCYKTLKSKFSYHPGAIIAVIVSVLAILTPIIVTFFGG